MAKATLCLGLCLVLGAGCRNQSQDHDHEHPDDHDHGHDHSQAHGTVEHNSQITVWTNGYEIFAEHPYAVAGKEVSFVTHVTRLESGKPRREGPLRFELAHDQHKALDYVDPAPVRDGIYISPLLFPQPGPWRVILHIARGDRQHSVPLPPIEVYPSESAAHEAPAPRALEGIRFLKEQQWKFGTTTEAVGQQRLIKRVRASGHVKPPPGSLAAVTPPLAGLLLPPEGKALPSLGGQVDAGEIVARIRPVTPDANAKVAEARSELTRTRIALEQAEQSYERIHKLAQVNAKSERELQEAKFNLETARARYQAAKTRFANYRASGYDLPAELPSEDANEEVQPAISLQAPISGIVIDQLNAAVGEFIGTDQTLFKILEPTKMWIEARIPEAEIVSLSRARQARYEIPGRPGEYHAIPEHDGAGLVFTGMEVDPQTRTIPLTYQVPNRDGRLRLGQAVHVQIETDAAEQALAIPESAVMEEDQRPVAYVQRGGETFEKRPVQLGIRDGRWVQVLEGLQAGDRVVTQGAYAVRLAGTSAAIPAHGHAH